MAFYTGKTKDGSDMREVQGMHISENGKEWSNKPYPVTRELNRHLRFANLTLKEGCQAILDGKSKISVFKSSNNFSSAEPNTSAK